MTISFSEIRVESNRLEKRQHCLGVLIVAVKLLALVEQAARAGTVLRQMIGHLRCISTIIRALLTAALATGGQNH